MRVAAFTKYDRAAASTRQRILQYGPSLSEAGIELRHYPLLGDDYVRSLETGDRPSRVRILGSYVRRLAQLLGSPDCDLIWVHAELFPYLPSAFERLVFRSRIPVIYDCDDAYFLTYNDNPRPLVRRMLSGKIERLISGASAVSSGNDYLRDHCAPLCRNTLIVPTVVDTDRYTPGDRSNGSTPVIGWIGSPSTWNQHVRPLLPLLEKFTSGGKATFRAVGAGWDAKRDRFRGMEFIPWSEASEIEQVREFDIGIMPLTDDAWARGKCGYKLIQYMACEVPSIASPVGVNRSIVTDDCGMLATTSGDWSAALARLLEDPPLRRRMGNASRKRVVDHYSLAVHAPRLSKLFLDVASEAKDGSGQVARKPRMRRT